ncbi:ankyrin repeat and KH domain-containing protein mask-like isoform X3 [Saccostrea cucullata]|uniref:ankyrin repeat and KH domain-containing protein mask-like isoform X3 n=1 Tax=Saccostrea cuccullata TaxID=36930 RepID=UPI002ED55303
MASSSYASTEETTNACRACRLLLGPCTDELRDVLRHYVPPSTFPHVIKIKRSNLPRLTAQQMNLILPRGSTYTGNYGDMDISLLYILLRNICGIPPHSNGWGFDPDPTDRSLSANIERIRIARNQCVHSSSPFLSNADFNTIWSTVRSAVVEIDSFLGNGNKFEKAVDFLRQETMDPLSDCRYIEELRKQAEEDAEIREIVQGLKRKAEEIDERYNKMQKSFDEIRKPKSVIPPHVKDVFEKDVIRWKEEDAVYSESHGFPAMLDQVRSQPYMTFVGVPGSGKSATIHHIALILQKEEYEVVPIIDIRKIEDYSDSRHPQVFVIDDVVGVMGLQKQKLESLIDYERTISNPSNRNTKVLMSCREAVINECFQSFFSNEKNIIKIHRSENALNDEDKISILQKHGLDRDLLSPTLLRETLDMFPLLCKLYSKEEKFRDNVQRFFTCPAECILEEFDKMQKQNSLCYATLVLCMLNEKKLSKVILKNTGNNVFLDMKSKLLESCEVESNTDAFKFVKALAAMEGTYTKLCGTEYTIIHDSVFEILAYHYGCQFPDLLLQYISSSYIANNVKVQECKEESEVEYKQDENEEFSAEEQETLSSETIQDSFELCIRLREDQYPMLAERLYRDIENMELYDVFMNNVLKHPKVCQAFIEVFKTKSYTELKSLFLSKQKDVSKVVSKGKRVSEESEKRDERSGEWRRHIMLVIENYDYLEITYSVRVISWVVCYGHSQILQYILEQTELHKETEIELFWNSFSPKLIYEANERRNNSEKDNATDKLFFLNSITDTRNQKQKNSQSIPEHDRLFVLSCYSGDLETVRILIKYIDLKQTNSNVKYLFPDTPLTAACKGGHMSVVKELIEAGADINLPGYHDTPLTAACHGGHMSLVKELIEAGADINQQGRYDTPLTAACGRGHMSVVKELIEAGADINQKGEVHKPLTAACKGGHMSVVKELIEAGAEINQQDRCYSPLTAACGRGHMSVVKELIEAGADINQQGGFHTPLTAACILGHMSVVKELIVAGAVINQQGEVHTPLTAAFQGGHMSIMKELIGAGADINQQSGMHTPLTAACQGGHMSLVKELIEAGADINQKGEVHTPLTAACEGGHMSLVKELIEAGADINPKGKYYTPLTAACKGGHKSVVKELVEAGADINQQGEYDTPLTAACEGGHLSVVNELIEAGADINPQGKNKTPLTAAFKGGYMSLVKQLIEAGSDINPQGTFETPLTAACKGGHMSVVKELIEAGADINQQGMFDTPLTAACHGGHMSVVKELIGAGADINLQGMFDTPLTAACEGGHTSVVKELIEAGADINQQDSCDTPLTAACKGGHMSVVKELIEAGADINQQGMFDTPLTAACEGGHMSIVKELIETGADVNQQGECDTPLTAACEGGHMSIVKELIEAGAEINQHGKFDSPLTAACTEGNISVVKVLIEAGADIDQQAGDDTPLTAACKGGHMSVVKELVEGGADINQKGKYDTPMTAASKGGYMSVVRELIEAGANNISQISQKHL